MMKKGEKRIERGLPLKELKRSLDVMMTREMRIGETGRTNPVSEMTGATTAEGEAGLREIGGRKETGTIGISSILNRINKI